MLSGKAGEERNPFALLNVSPAADTKSIKSAFRRKARECHPDKGNTADSSEFIKLCEAFAVLLDPDQRREAARRNREFREKARQLDGESRSHDNVALGEEKSRRKFRQNLETSEARLSTAASAARCEARRAAQVERLRREAEVLLEVEKETVLANLLSRLAVATNSVTDAPVIRVKWGRDSRVLYGETELRRVFHKYGRVENIVVNPGRCSGLVELDQLASARIAVNTELGYQDSPLVLKALFSDTESRYIGVMCASTNKSLLDFEHIILDRLRNSQLSDTGKKILLPET